MPSSYNIYKRLDELSRELYPDIPDVLNYAVMSHLEQEKQKACKAAYRDGYLACHQDIKEDLLLLQQVVAVVKSQHKDATKLTKITKLLSSKLSL